MTEAVFKILLILLMSLLIISCEPDIITHQTLLSVIEENGDNIVVVNNNLNKTNENLKVINENLKIINENCKR